MNILAIGAHPDDLDITCGGTLLRFRRAGENVVMCVVTDGRAHPLGDPEQVSARRRREAQVSADLIGGAISQSSSWRESGLVFTTDIGTPISPRNLVRHFKSKLQQAGLPDIRFHDLRHTTASLLLEKNVHPKIVSELLGHSTITLNTYSHIINPINKIASDQMDDMFKE